jgi:hypothetical protein
MAMMTPEQAQLNDDEFAAGYEEDQAAPVEQSEDEAFGLGPEAPEAAPEEPAIAEAAAPETAAPEAEADPALSADPEAAETGDGGEVTEAEPLSEPASQQERSWEGRLKAKEAELKAREAELKAREAALATPEMAAEGETPAEEAAEPASTEMIEDVAEQVQSGEITMEQAMKVLSSDFGEDFTKMLDVLISAKAAEIAGKTADEKVAGVSTKLDGVIGELVDDRAREHFESIADQHPDYMEVGASQEFKGYIEAMPATEKEAAINVIGSGRAREINKLLTQYKKSMQEAPAGEPVVDTPDESAMDAAEGVRGKALKLPDQPSKNDGYEDAWRDF